MPVITQASLPEVRIPYIVIGFVVLCCVGIWMRRKEKLERLRMEERNTKWPSAMLKISEDEKEMVFSQDERPRYQPRPHLPPHPQPPPFPPPVPTNPIQEVPLSNASYYDLHETYDDPPVYFEPASFAQNDSFEGEFGIPRRRSYTKRIDGKHGEGMMEVSGEIVVAEGWRRHTRVFGGGVCKACEESDERRRMTS